MSGGGFYHFPDGMSVGEAMDRVELLRELASELRRIVGSEDAPAVRELYALAELAHDLRGRWDKLRGVVRTLDRHASGDESADRVREAALMFAAAKPFPSNA